MESAFDVAQFKHLPRDVSGCIRYFLQQQQLCDLESFKHATLNCKYFTIDIFISQAFPPVANKQKTMKKHHFNSIIHVSVSEW